MAGIDVLSGRPLQRSLSFRGTVGPGYVTIRLGTATRRAASRFVLHRFGPEDPHAPPSGLTSVIRHWNSDRRDTRER